MRTRKTARVALATVLVLAVAALPAFAATPYQYVTAWGSTGAAQGQFDGAYGADADIYGNVYVADTNNHRIQVFGPGGDVIGVWGKNGGGPGNSGSGNGEFDSPTDVAVTPDGDVYVADFANDRVQLLTLDGDFVAKWGSPGNGPGQFSHPFYVGVDSRGDVYVSETINNRVQKFDSDGNPITMWGGLPTGNADGQFAFPYGVAIGPDDRVYVADHMNHRIQVFDSDGNFLEKWGKAGGGLGNGDGEFNQPTDLAFDATDSLFVADTRNNRVQKFEADGTFDTKWGSAAAGDMFMDEVAGVAAGASRDVFTADLKANRMKKFFSPVPSTTNEIAGLTRYETAVKASKEAFPNGLAEDSQGFKTVVIATGSNWPDALGASSLAGVVGGPLLLSFTGAEPAEDRLLPTVADEVQRLGATRAFVIGGEGVVGPAVVAQLAGLGVGTVERLAGSDRYGTANAVAQKAVTLQSGGFDGACFVATGLNFPDALAGSPLAAANGWPLFLSGPTGLSAETLATMQSVGMKEALLLGGTGVVSPQIEQALITSLGSGAVERLAGPDRYATAVAVADYGTSAGNLSWSHTALSTGEDFPDALAGGVLQGSDHSVMLLTRTSALPPATSAALSANKAGIYELRYLGGAGVVPPAVRSSAEALLY